MAPTLRSFTRLIIQAFTDEGIEDQLKEYDPLLLPPYSLPSSGRGRYVRPPRPTINRPMAANCEFRLLQGVWVEMSNEVWREMQRARRAGRLRAVRRRGVVGREAKVRRFLGGRKGKKPEGGCRRYPAGAVVVVNGVEKKVGGQFRARGA